MEHIDQRVQELLKEHNTNCPFKIAKERGILVIQENLGSLYGYCNKAFRIPMIHINENLSEGEKIFTCGHELTHAIEHPDINTPFLKKNTFFSTDKFEMEAHYLSIQLIFAQDFFDDQVSLSEAVEYYGIPEKLILNMIQNKKIK